MTQIPNVHLASVPNVQIAKAPIEQIAYTPKEEIGSLQKELKSEPERSHLNFETDETLTIEGIIRVTFANPNRRKFVQSKSQVGNYPIHADLINPETLI